MDDGSGGFSSAPPNDTSLSEQDRLDLERAALAFVDAQSVIIALADLLGALMAKVVKPVFSVADGWASEDLKKRTEAAVEHALWQAQSASMFGLDDVSDSPPWTWTHKLIAVISGAGAGFVGATGLLWDLPVTTGIIMRSVAQIARSFPGEDLSSDCTKRACIEVFALGGPETDDDDLEIGYWSVRFGVSHLVIERIIKFAAARLGAQLAEKAVAQAVPVIGMVTGATLNYTFVEYYQQMASVHFTIRGVERRHADNTAVGSYFRVCVANIRKRRKLRERRRST